MAYSLFAVIMIPGLVLSIPQTHFRQDPTFVNELDGYHVTWNIYNGNPFIMHLTDYSAGYFLSGVFSTHNSRAEDRQFRWKYRRPLQRGRFVSSRALPITSLDAPFTRSCASIPNAAIYAARSVHDNRAEDRQWDFFCGSLASDSFALNGCAWSDSGDNYRNQFDGELNYECPNQGVIRAVESIHDNNREDRRWRFECCNIVNAGEIAWSGMTGEWDLYASVPGSGGVEFMIESGFTSEVVEVAETQFEESLSVAISSGFSFFGIDNEVNIEGNVGRTISNALSSSIQETSNTAFTFFCDKAYVFQWVMSGEVVIGNSGNENSGSFSLGANSLFLCTDCRPRCPILFCNLEDDCASCLAPFENLSGEC